VMWQVVFYYTYCTVDLSISQPVASSVQSMGWVPTIVAYWPWTKDYKYFHSNDSVSCMISCSLANTSVLSVKILWVDVHLESVRKYDFLWIFRDIHHRCLFLFL
jgi:hypothetical protein